MATSPKRAPLELEPAQYVNTQMAPDRVEALQRAELDYVNGIPEEDNPHLITWPSYRDLAAQHGIPLRVVEQKALKHKWVRRREERKQALELYQLGQMQQKWRKADREIMEQHQSISRQLSYVQQRKAYEMVRKVQMAITEEEAQHRAGNTDFFVEVEIKQSDLESLGRLLKTTGEAQAAVIRRGMELPMNMHEIHELPAPLLTAEQDEAQHHQATALPSDDVLEIYKLMCAIEEQHLRSGQQTIQGELDED